MLLNETEIKLLALKRNELAINYNKKIITEEVYNKEMEKFDKMLKDHMYEFHKQRQVGK